MYRLYTILPLCMLLAACLGSRPEQVQQKMKQIREEKAQPITQPPVFELIRSFEYGATALRSPFMPPSLMDRLEQEAIRGNTVVPDTNRPAEHLEQFELTQLVMRGIFEEPLGSRYALIEDPSGKLIRVHVGNHMGKNYGRIVEIMPRQVNLIEIVREGADKFVERPKTLLAPEES